MELSQEGTIHILTLRGRLDAPVAGLVKERLQALIDEGAARVVVNLNGVEFLDSSGLGVLVSTLRRIKEKKGEIKLAGLRPEVRSIFDITRVARLFHICPDVPASIEAFQRMG
jgi:anti-sigma B factor antagonist